MEKLLDLFICSFIDRMIMLVVNKRMFEYCGNIYKTVQCLKKEIRYCYFCYQKSCSAQDKEEAGAPR